MTDEALMQRPFSTKTTVKAKYPKQNSQRMVVVVGTELTHTIPVHLSSPLFISLKLSTPNWDIPGDSGVPLRKGGVGEVRAIS